MGRSFPPGCVTLGGSFIELLADHIGRRKNAVIDCAGFANEAKPLELGFRNESCDLAHLDSL